METFNVLLWDFNRDELVHYDVLPYLRDRYEERKKRFEMAGKDKELWKVPHRRLPSSEAAQTSAIPKATGRSTSGSSGIRAASFLRLRPEPCRSPGIFPREM